MSWTISRSRPSHTSTRETAAAPLSIDARLALASVEMDARLATASIAHSVNGARPETVLDYADVVRLTPTSDSAPVAALLERARQRVLQPDGWSRDTGTNGRGGTCLLYAIQAEARDAREEREARVMLRRAVGGGDPVPTINRRLTGAAQAAQILGRAAELADTEGV